MVSLPMIMIDKLKDDLTKTSFAKRHNPVARRQYIGGVEGDWRKGSCSRNGAKQHR
jgi:hypothetical protein